MADPKYNFQYCQKLILFSSDWTKVLLAKRQGEADYDGSWSFICGKMEISDKSIIDGLRREKDEEIGESARINVYPIVTTNVLFKKRDGSSMILPHYLGQFAGGKMRLNTDEYSEYRWVPVSELEKLEPKVENIPALVDWALSIRQFARPEDYTEI